jgi:predicted helicase
MRRSRAIAWTGEAKRDIPYIRAHCGYPYKSTRFTTSFTKKFLFFDKAWRTRVKKIKKITPRAAARAQPAFLNQKLMYHLRLREVEVHAPSLLQSK